MRKPLIPAASAAADTGTAAAEPGCAEAAAARSAGLAMTEPMDAAVERAAAGLSSAACLRAAAGPCICGPSQLQLAMQHCVHCLESLASQRDHIESVI